MLGYTDDILSVALWGQDSLNLNISLNTQIETKKLRFHTPNADGKSKCHFIHVGKKSHSCPKLQVHDTDIEQERLKSNIKLRVCVVENMFGLKYVWFGSISMAL